MNLKINFIITKLKMCISINTHKQNLLVSVTQLRSMYACMSYTL